MRKGFLIKASVFIFIILLIRSEQIDTISQIKNSAYDSNLPNYLRSYRSIRLCKKNSIGIHDKLECNQNFQKFLKSIKQMYKPQNFRNNANKDTFGR